MDAFEFIQASKRDALILQALHRALYAMQLTQGATISFDSIRGTLNFSREMLLILDALGSLGADPNEPLIFLP